MLFLVMLPDIAGDIIKAAADARKFRMIPRPMADGADASVPDPVGRYILAANSRGALLEPIPDRQAQLAGTVSRGLVTGWCVPLTEEQVRAYWDESRTTIDPGGNPYTPPISDDRLTEQGRGEESFRAALLGSKVLGWPEWPAVEATPYSPPESDQ